MHLESIQAITFDAVGTLIAPYPSVGEIYAEELATLGYSLNPDQLETGFISSFKKFKHNHPDALLNRDAWRIIVSTTFNGLIPSDKFDTHFQKLWDAFAQPERWRILPGTEETLRYLHAKGLRLFVLSNNDERLHTILKGLIIGQFFEEVFVSAELGAEKPALSLFQLVQSRIEVSPSKILHVGDSFNEDVQGAVKAGWHAALVGKEPDTPLEIGHFMRASNIYALFFENLNQKKSSENINPSE